MEGAMKEGASKEGAKEVGATMRRQSAWKARLICKEGATEAMRAFPYQER